MDTVLSSTEIQEIRALAEQGDLDAQYELALMYYEGDYAPLYYGIITDEGGSVPQDNEKAYMWFSLAASLDDGEMLELVAQRMTPEQIANAKIMAREWEVAHW